MINYAILDGVGLVIGTGKAQDEFEAGAAGADMGTVQLIPEGVSVLAGEHYYDGEDFQSLPPQPEDWYEWTGTEWADIRDPAQIVVDLHQARYRTNTDKNQVMYRLAQAGAYPMSQLSDDGSYFPLRVEQYLNSIPAAEHDIVKAALKYEAKIWRLHPYFIGEPAQSIQGFIPWLFMHHGVNITEDQLDEIFDVPVPPPYAG